jgi:hypothetical protein
MLLALRICVRVGERFKEGFAIFVTLSWCNRALFARGPVTPESAGDLLHVDGDRVGRRNKIVIRCGPSH